MNRRFIVGLIVVAFILCAGVSSASAQGGLEDLRLKLENTRYEMEQLEYNHKQEMADIKNDTNSKLRALKKKFHSDRAVLLANKKAEEKKVADAYEAKIRPLEIQKKQLLNSIEPVDTGNFVKNR